MSEPNPLPEPTDAPLAEPAPEAARAEVPPIGGPPSGLRRGDRAGREIIDAMAGRASVFGFGFAPITDAIRSAGDEYLGDAAAWEEETLTAGEAVAETAGERREDSDPVREVLQGLLGNEPAVSPDSVLVCSSADMAVETALQLARTGHADERYRTVTLVGSDHGRSGMCRTASGRPELHRGFGPMMAGFRHVPAGDLEALQAAVDDQTACVLVSPIDLHEGAKALGADYLLALRQRCDEQGAWLILDETQLCFGASGQPFSFAAIADVHADAVVVAGGLFGGLPGGLVIASQRCGARATPPDRYPLLTRLAATTLEQLVEQSLLEDSGESAHALAVELADRVGRLESVRDLNALGMTIGIETDLPARELVRVAAGQGLRLEAAGETAVRLQPPLRIGPEDRSELVRRLGEAFETAQREIADASVS